MEIFLAKQLVVFVVTFFGLGGTVSVEVEQKGAGVGSLPAAGVLVIITISGDVKLKHTSVVM